MGRLISTSAAAGPLGCHAPESGPIIITESFIGRDPEGTRGFISLIHLNTGRSDGGNLATAGIGEDRRKQWRGA